MTFSHLVELPSDSIIFPLPHVAELVVDRGLDTTNNPYAFRWRKRKSKKRRRNLEWWQAEKACFSGVAAGPIFRMSWILSRRRLVAPSHPAASLSASSFSACALASSCGQAQQGSLSAFRGDAS